MAVRPVTSVYLVLGFAKHTVKTSLDRRNRGAMRLWPPTKSDRESGNEFEGEWALNGRIHRSRLRNK